MLAENHRMKITLGVIVGFAIGFLTHVMLTHNSTIERDWEMVRRYNAFVSDPANYRPDAQTGLSRTTPPVDPEPSLAALVAAGELRHVDLVLPTVVYGRESARRWMTFAQAHKEIVYITGNPSYTAFSVVGQQPLHLNIWYRDTDQAVVQTMVAELESGSPKGSQQDGPANGSQPIRSETNRTSSAAGSRR